MQVDELHGLKANPDRPPGKPGACSPENQRVMLKQSTSYMTSWFTRRVTFKAPCGVGGSHGEKRVARVTEIIAGSPKSFDDAVKAGISRANATLRGITASRCWSRTSPWSTARSWSTGCAWK